MLRSGGGTIKVKHSLEFESHWREEESLGTAGPPTN